VTRRPNGRRWSLKSLLLSQLGSSAKMVLEADLWLCGRDRMRKTASAAILPTRQMNNPG
jgi:hypothetical protein